MSLEVRSFYPTGPGTNSFFLGSRVMNPNEAHKIACHVDSRPHYASGGIELTVVMEVDGVRKPMLVKVFSADDLADAYEQAHHIVHGYDARGLDPRQGATRLKP